MLGCGSPSRRDRFSRRERHRCPLTSTAAPSAAKTSRPCRSSATRLSTTCPTCGGRLRKVFNAVGVVFKGSGFYRTDSRNGSKSGAMVLTRGLGRQEVGAETKSADKEPAGSGSAGSNGSSNGKQPISSEDHSSTGQKRQFQLALWTSADDRAAHP